MYISEPCLFAAFMTIEREEHFIVLDGFGNECQRFYHPHLKRFNRVTPSFEYSAYHMSDYSFTEDLIFLGTGDWCRVKGPPGVPLHELDS